MVYKRRVIVASVLCLLLVSPAWTQEDPCLRRTVPVSVGDSHGQVVKGLTPSDFRAEIKGKPLQILSVQPEMRPHRVVVLLESSSSMNDGHDEWDLARSVATDALQSSPRSFRAGFLLFDEQARLEFPVQDEPREALESVNGLKPGARGPDTIFGRQTALWDALKQALALLDPPEFGDAIYLISDGRDNRSRATPDELSVLLAGRGIRLFVILFAPLERRATIDEVSVLDDIFKIASNSGGRVLPVPVVLMPFDHTIYNFNLSPYRSKLFNAGLAALNLQLRSTLRLEVSLPEELKKPGEWKLTFAAPKDPKAPGLLIYPKLLDACPAQAASAH
jgi:von Willebrand factor type A domain